MLPFAAVFVGAVAMGIGPVFVRVAEVGPITSAFWRVALAFPFLWALARHELRTTPRPQGRLPPAAIILAGVFFVGDLIFWHLSIVKTTVANATLLATIAPVWVALLAGLVLGERITRLTTCGLALCLLGAGLLVGNSIRLTPQNLVGDFFGFATSIFFGLYILAVRIARRAHRPAHVMAVSTLITAIGLLAFALVMEDQLFPATIQGLSALVALALVSHVGGQGLLAYALGHLPAVFSSLVIFIEALTAAILGWLIFGENIGFLQIFGGVSILLGIWIARPTAR